MRRSTSERQQRDGEARQAHRRHRSRLWRRQGRLAKDVLILVRRRGALFEAIIRALKNEGIPVAGADRLVLTEHIAVMDLMALADALLLPEDDLALATVLKSPLFGLDDDDLFKLAWDRKGSLRVGAPRAAADLAARLDAIARRRARSRRSRSTPTCSAPTAGAGRSWGGSATRPTTRSTSSSISRSTTSAPRRRRCRASWPGCARPGPR